jgi:nicotinamide-nucleotide amidase
VKGPTVEVVAAGNEVLLGDVLDTNTNWLCRRITALGGRIVRTVMVRDEVQTIASEIQAALARRPALLFTVGGLGPTNDDLTLQGVALGTGRPLQLNAGAERMVRQRYEQFAASGHVPFADMNRARRKMACLPTGAEPVVNPVGGAPGVLLEVDDTAIVSLPGVPEELRAIVDESLGELFGRVFGTAHYEERALVVGLQDESAIAEVLQRVDAEHPEVYVKSRARVIGGDRIIRVTISARAEDRQAVDALLGPVARQLIEGIGAAGYAARLETPDD